MIDELSAKIKRRFKRVVNNVSTKFNWFDMSGGIDTGECIDKENIFDENTPNVEHLNRYGPTNIKQLKRSLKELITIDKTLLDSGFIDIGCGKGRVLIMAERLGFKKVIGVEYSKELCDICEENIKKIKSKVIEVVCEDALKYQFKGEIRTFYFYNPFDFCLLEPVLENIRNYLKDKSFDAYIVYVDPRKFGRLHADDYELLVKNEGALNPYHIYKVLK